MDEKNKLLCFLIFILNNMGVYTKGMPMYCIWVPSNYKVCGFVALFMWCICVCLSLST